MVLTIERSEAPDTAEIQKTTAAARASLSKHDYAYAVYWLDQLPEGFRDEALYRETLSKHERVTALKRRIDEPLPQMNANFMMLLHIVEELLQLQPSDADVLQWKTQIDKHVAERFGRAECPLIENSSSAAVPVQRVPANPVAPRVAVKQGTKAGERMSFKLGGVEYGFRWCPAGKFTMGSPQSEAGRYDNEAQVEVELMRGFWLQETQVTQGMWESVMGTTPWKGQQYVKEGAKIAASYVTWNEACEFCEKLQASAREASVLSGSGKIVLPTEARWEYACRAGTSTAYSFGNDAGKLGEYGWYDRNAWDKGAKYAHEVGMKKANGWSLLDLHGNVWEWCEDTYNAKLPGGRDPLQNAGSSRVVRGGSFNCEPHFVRCAFRHFLDPTFRGDLSGFRVVVES